MPRILHLADLHLGWTPRFMPADRAACRREARDRLLERAVEFALGPGNRIDLVVIAGDLFETHTPDAALVGRVTAALGRLQVPLVTVPGNHDEITYAGSVYRTVRWPGTLVSGPRAHPVGTVRCGDVDVHVYGLAYTGGVTPGGEPLRDFPRLDAEGVHLAIFHGTLGNWGGDRSLPLDRAALAASGYDYVALGHLHGHAVEILGRTTAVYPGMVEGKGFDDPGVGHLTVAEVAPGRAVVEKVPLACMPVVTHRIDVSGLVNGEALEEAVLRRADSRAVTRVRLGGAVSFEVAADTLAAQLAEHFFHLEVVDESVRLTESALADDASADTVLGLFVRRLQAEIADADEPRRSVLRQALQRGVHALKGGRPCAG